MTLLLLACATGSGSKPDTAESASPDSVDSGAETGRETSETDAETGRESGADTSPETGESGDPVDPFDVDGDGVRSDAGDCDDDDARVYPGAEDPCDAIDQDCDGVAQPEGSCSELVMLDAASVGGWVGGTVGSLISIHEADTDYDGDGVADILTFESCTTWGEYSYCNNNVALLPGRIPDGEVSTPVSGAPFWIADPAHDWTTDFGSAGDFDGDGSTDLFIAARGCWPDDGSLYLMLGPYSRWPTAGDTTRGAADAWWSQAESDDCFAEAASGGADADGDGLDDLIVVTNGPAPFAYVRGRATGLSAGMPILDETWFADSYHAAALVPDIDGDGLGDVLVELPQDDARVMGFVPPSLLADGVAGVALADVSDIVPHPDYYSLYLLDGRSDLGDVNGDGLTDVAVVAFSDVNADGLYDECAGILSGSTSLRTASTLDPLIGGLVCVDGADNGHGDADRIADDIDGDGVPDVVFNQPYTSAGREYVGCVVPSSRRPAAGWELLQDVRPYCFGVAGAGYAGAVLDLDGDGFPEILGSNSDYIGERGQIMVTPGFDIPFDDDSRW